MPAPRKKAARSTAGKAKKPKKEKHAFNDPALASSVNQWVEAKAASEQAEEDLAEAEAVILPRVEEERVKASVASGECVVTVVVNGKISVAQGKRYKAVSAEDAATLRKRFGADAKRYFPTRRSLSVKADIAEDDEQLQEVLDALGSELLERFFVVRRTLAVKADVAGDEDGLDALVEALGPKRVARFFEIKESVGVSEEFHAERSTRPEVAQRAEKALKEGLLGSYKASIRLA